jgi:hypothetical protein
MTQNVPRAVLEAEERANRLQEELIAQQTQAATERAAENQPPQEGTQAAQENQPNTTDSQNPPAPAQEDNWEHRFKVLQGKYNSEVPRFAEQVRELTKRLEGLEHENQKLKEEPPKPLVTQQEIDEYGEGLIDVARRIAQEEVAKKQSEIDTLKRQLDSVSQAATNTASNDFYRSLTEMVPDWEQLNTDPNFLKWLEEIDELTGEPRMSLLARVEQLRDPVRVAKFFTSYKKTSQTWAANAQSSLAQQVVPPTNKAPETPPAKKVWTRGEIAEFYSRLKRGEVGDQEALAIEADITAASIEGRIR